VKVGLMIIATNKYIEFMPELYESYKKYFFKNHSRKLFLFTDKEFKNAEIIKIEHEAWPNITLKRFEYICNTDFDIDYLYYLDADSLIVNNIGEEILGDMVGTLHQGYVNRGWKPFDQNQNSTAYVENGDYYTGCFWGGKIDKIKTMSEILKNNINKDSEIGYVARWHDESHLNWYFNKYPPDKKLSPSYNYSDDFPNDYKPIIKCLRKNVEYYRT